MTTEHEITGLSPEIASAIEEAHEMARVAAHDLERAREAAETAQAFAEWASKNPHKLMELLEAFDALEARGETASFEAISQYLHSKEN